MLKSLIKRLTKPHVEAATAALTKEIEELTLRNSSLQAETAEARATNAVLYARYTSADAEAATLRDEVESLGASLKTATAEVTRLETAFSGKVDECARLTATIAHLETTGNTLAEQVTATMERCKKFEELATTLKEALNNMEKVEVIREVEVRVPVDSREAHLWRFVRENFRNIQLLFAPGASGDIISGAIPTRLPMNPEAFEKAITSIQNTGTYSR